MISRNLVLCKARNGDPIHIGDTVYIAGVGNCEVVYNKFELAVAFDRGDEQYSYSDIIEDLEKVITTCNE